MLDERMTAVSPKTKIFVCKPGELWSSTPLLCVPTQDGGVRLPAPECGIAEVDPSALASSSVT
jgi:hypothetical protein